MRRHVPRDPVIRTAADQAREDRRRHIAYGVGTLLVLGVLALLVGGGREPRRKGPERLPPAPKRVRFQVQPAGARALSISLTDGEGVQQILRPGVLSELELSGTVHWTVQAPGFRAKHGTFEVPYGPDDGIFEVAVSLEPTQGNRRPRRPSFGRIELGGAR